MTVKLTEQLCKFVVDTKIEDIPDEAVQKAATMFIDIIGVAMAGTAIEETGKIAIEYVKKYGGIPEATVIGGKLRTSAPYAAMTNALLAHALDFDDWEPSGHPSGMIVASCLALGEKLGLSGRRALEAYLLGLEVYERTGAADPNLLSRGWHGTAVCGTMGSAAASAKMLGLNLRETMMAIGIAASSAGGILRENGTMTKPYQVGKSARAGVEAALLAKEGFTGDEGILENPGGYLDCFLGKGNWNPDKMLENLGNPFHIISPGVGIKPYPCGGVKFFRSIEAILELRRENNISYKDVKEVEVRVSQRQMNLDITVPSTGLEGKFSMRYICGRAILDGKLNLMTFTDEAVKQPAVKEAMGKINVIIDESVPNDWLKTYAAVTIKLHGGKAFSKKVVMPKGDQRNPLPKENILQKYRENASLVIPQKQAEMALQMMQNLPDGQDIRELMKALR